MPLGKYYCDYCDKEFQDTPYVRKRHLQGLQHLRNKALWFDSFQFKGLSFFFFFFFSLYLYDSLTFFFFFTKLLFSLQMLTRLTLKDLAKGSATALSRRYLFENLSLDCNFFGYPCRFIGYWIMGLWQNLD